MSPKAPSMSSHGSCSSSHHHTETDHDSLFSSSSGSVDNDERNNPPPHLARVQMPASRRRRRRPANGRGTDSDEEDPNAEDDAGGSLVNEEEKEAAEKEKSEEERSGSADSVPEEQSEPDDANVEDVDNAVRDTSLQQKQRSSGSGSIRSAAASNHPEELEKEEQDDRDQAEPLDEKQKDVDDDDMEESAERKDGEELPEERSSPGDEDADLHHEDSSQQDEDVAFNDADTSPQQKPSPSIPSSSDDHPQTTTYVRTVEFDADAIRAQILCRLCQGLYREPYTTIKCRHTFCKSCLATALHASTFSTSEAFNACPQCQLYLGRQADPASVALPDRTLESLIDKVLFPQLAKADREAEWALYQSLGIERKDLPGETLLQRQQQQQQQLLDADASHPERSPKRTRSDASDVWEESKEVCTATTVLFQLVPGSRNSDDDVQETRTLQLPFLKTEGSVRVEQLKRYIVQKLDLHADMEVVMRCYSVVLPDKMTVAQIEDSIWEKTTSKNTMMQLSYTLSSTDKD